ncbi:hypothetical protein [Alloalcanivorax xenomutans]|uniref:hypothetical protein n=1 Tax=Alloalcanivorax xenomutans TaxID=1094342 RepID=UPI0024E1A6F1|nr:hypothetical protein [Alloalcanivorax xenomutans]
MKTKYRMSEEKLVNLVSQRLSEDGFAVQHEVPSMGKSIDIVAQKAGKIWAVEAKIGNWRRAVGQCRAHECVADYICVAVDKLPLQSKIIEELSLLGYGLLTLDCDQRLRWVLMPKENDLVWGPQKEKLEANMEGIGYAY